MHVSYLKSAGWNFTKFGKNLPKGWKTTGARLLHHQTWAGWNFLKFQKVRSIIPNTIGDNGLGRSSSGQTYTTGMVGSFCKVLNCSTYDARVEVRKGSIEDACK